MLILVRGKNNSGKSSLAEKLTVKFGQKHYYIATMLPYGEKGRARVQKHITQRAELGFITVEEPYSVGTLNIPSDVAVLLEDVSNLLANAVFDQGLSTAEVFEDIKLLYQHVDCLVAVTISEFDEGNYDDETRLYIQSLTWLNQCLYTLADVIIEMQTGRPVFIKGVLHELD